MAKEEQTLSRSSSSDSMKSALDRTPIPPHAPASSSESSPSISAQTSDEEAAFSRRDSSSATSLSLHQSSQSCSPKSLTMEDDTERFSVSLSEVQLKSPISPDEQDVATPITPANAIFKRNEDLFNSTASNISYRNSLPASPSLASTSQATFAPSSPSVVRANKRRTVHSTNSMTSGGNNSDNLDFLLQRLETQNALLKLEEKQAHGSLGERRRSQQQMLMDDFERKREELQNEDGLIDWDFWGQVANDYEKVAREHPKQLSRAIQRGIPPPLRGMMWQLMSASKDLELEQVYSDLLKQSSPHEKAIMRDLSRTFPNHDYFREGGEPGTGTGQENLFNVVKAYSLYDEEVGYCQGLQFIVGPLLLNMPDEEAFCVLVRLMKSYDLRSLFMPNMPGLQQRLFQFDRLVEEMLPTVFMRLLREGVKSSMYASQWFLTLFGYRFPLELVAGVMDLVFAEGIEAVFRFSVSLLKANEHAILEMEFEQLLDFLKNGLFEPWRAVTPAGEPDLDAETPYKASKFVKDALQVRITPLLLDQFAAEWQTMKKQQDAVNQELEQLRRSNAHLSLQVRSLEASLAQINQEHCDLVKQVVMSKLEREELEDELVKYKLMFADLSHRKASASAASVSSPVVIDDAPLFSPSLASTSASFGSAASNLFTGIRPSWGRAANSSDS